MKKLVLGIMIIATMLIAVPVKADTREAVYDEAYQSLIDELNDMDEVVDSSLDAHWDNERQTFVADLYMTFGEINDGYNDPLSNATYRLGIDITDHCDWSFVNTTDRDLLVYSDILIQEHHYTIDELWKIY